MVKSRKKYIIALIQIKVFALKRAYIWYVQWLFFKSHVSMTLQHLQDQNGLSVK